MTRSRFLLLLAGVSGVAAVGYVASRRNWFSRQPDRERTSIEHRVAQCGARADARLRPAFTRAGVPYPPTEVALLAFKDTRELEVHARATRRYRSLENSASPSDAARQAGASGVFAMMCY